MTQMRLAKLELFSTGTIFPSSSPKVRNLGGAIFLVAIDDYCSLDEDLHACAQSFLFPSTAQWEDHYHWALSLAEGLDPKWLRDALDRARAGWDRQRATGARKRSRKSPSLMRRKACDLTRGRSRDVLAVEQTGAAGDAGDRGAAAEL